MGAAWAALLGAIVGGVFTLIGGLAVEVRRDRRRQIAAARTVSSDLSRSWVEISVLVDSSQETWLEGPHQGIGMPAWHADAAYFVGRLSTEEFENIDDLSRELTSAGELGFLVGEADALRESIGFAQAFIKPHARPSGFDRLVLRL